MSFLHVKKCFSEPKHLIKLLVLIVCICFTISQLSQCFKKIMHPPISTYYSFTLNETIKYPTLTICKRPEYRTDLFKRYGIDTKVLTDHKAFDNFNFEKYSVETFLKDVTHKYENVFTLTSYMGAEFMKNDSRMGATSFFNFYAGQCHTITPRLSSSTFGVSGGYFLYLSHETLTKSRDIYGISKSGFQIYLHDSKEVLRNSEEQAGTFLEYLYLESAEEMRLVIKVQKYSQIHTANDPCISDPDYSESKCLEECIDRQIAENTGCTLPWLRVPSLEFPQCSNASTVSSVIKAIRNEREQLGKNCNCVNACDLSIYSTQIISKTNSTDGDSSSLITIYYSTNLVTQMREVISYDWNVFLSDIGGSLGFLLGLSVIGFITVLEEIIRFFVSCCRRKRVKETAASTETPNNEPNVEPQATNEETDFYKLINSIMFKESDKLQDSNKKY